MSRAGTVVVCIGNPFRHDDGVACAVAERARAALPAAVRVVELDGEPARVIDAWEGSALAVVVDAARSGAPAGTIMRIDVDNGTALPDGTSATTHSFGLGPTVALARALDRLPGRLVVYAVEGADWSPGPGLSAPVAAAVTEVLLLLSDEVA